MKTDPSVASMTAMILSAGEPVRASRAARHHDVRRITVHRSPARATDVICVNLCDLPALAHQRSARRLCELRVTDLAPA